MIGIRVTVPVACFRKGLARDYWETEPLPPPSTCYGFLLSLVGEADREAHLGVRVTAGLLSCPGRSTVLRTAWRVKQGKYSAGQGTNVTPTEQELLTGLELVIWLDSAEEAVSPTLEDRIAASLANPTEIRRYGGLSLGESAHLVNEVHLHLMEPCPDRQQQLFVITPDGRLSLPVWVDHVGHEATRLAAGDLREVPIEAPDTADMPIIAPSVGMAPAS